MNKYTHNKLLMLVAMLAVVAGVFWLHRSETDTIGKNDPVKAASSKHLPISQADTHHPPVTGTPDAKSSSENPTSSIVSPNQGRSPDRDMPLDQRIAVLEERADHGELDANCALLKALDRCKKVNKDDTFTNYTVLNQMSYLKADHPDLPQLTQRFARIQIEQQQLLEQCARVPESSQIATLDNLLRLAQAGNISASVRFVASDSSELIASPESYRLYRQHAFMLFRRGIEAGEPLMALLWRNATTQDTSALAGVIPPDWRTPDVAIALVNRLYQEMPQGFPIPSSEPGAAAIAEAERLFQLYFANSAQLTKWVQTEKNSRRQRQENSKSMLAALESNEDYSPFNDLSCGDH